MLKKQTEILYLITDFSYGEEKIKEALRAGVDIVQLREKNITSGEYLRRAKLMRQWTREYQAIFLVNDRADIAFLSDADGVHVGQEDIPATEARKLLGADKIVGVTAKTVEQAVKAEQEGADYLGSGAWFPTTTKQDAVPITEEVYRAIVRAVTIPNVAVGGITANNAERPLQCGGAGIVVSAGIMAASDIGKMVGCFKGLLAEHNRYMIRG